MTWRSAKLTKLELQIMEALWNQGQVSIREIQETFSRKGPARLHHDPNHRVPLGNKKVVRRVKKSRQFSNIFEAAVSSQCRAAKADR